MQTRLGKKLANGAAADPPATATPTPLSRTIALGRRGENVTLPFLGPARVELVGALDSQEIDAEVHREMQRRELPFVPGTSERFELERAFRTLARAVRDPANPSLPFGTVEEWGALDCDVINAAWHTYGDVRDRLDPLATIVSDEDLLAFELAVKKNDATQWKTFGIAKLSALLASLGDRLSTSLAASSSSSESPPAC